MERAHKEMQDYLHMYNQHKTYKRKQAEKEKIDDRTMLKIYWNIFSEIKIILSNDQNVQKI